MQETTRYYIPMAVEIIILSTFKNQDIKKLRLNQSLITKLAVMTTLVFKC